MSKISKTPLLDKYASLINQKPEYRNLDDSQKETRLRGILCELDRLRDTESSPGKPDSVTECFQIVRNIANFAGRESGIPERYRPVFERARIAGLDESDTAKYIDSMLTKEDIQSYKNAAYADGREDGFDEGLARGNGISSKPLSRL